MTESSNQRDERRALRNTIATAAMAAIYDSRRREGHSGKTIAMESSDLADLMLAEADMRNMSEDEAAGDGAADEQSVADGLDEQTERLREAARSLTESMTPQR